jgi:hypothetical protein
MRSALALGAALGLAAVAALVALARTEGDAGPGISRAEAEAGALASLCPESAMVVDSVTRTSYTLREAGRPGQPRAAWAVVLAGALDTNCLRDDRDAPAEPAVETTIIVGVDAETGAIVSLEAP